MDVPSIEVSWFIWAYITLLLNNSSAQMEKNYLELHSNVDYLFWAKYGPHVAKKQNLFNLVLSL